MTAIVTRELAIDVGDDPGLRGAGKIVSWDDLIAKSGETKGVAVAQEIPCGAGSMATADNRCSAAEGSSQSKLPSS